MVSLRQVLSLVCRALPVLLAVAGTAEYVAADTPHLWRALGFLYVALATLMWNQRRPLASPVAAAGVLAGFALVDPVAATEPNTTFLLAMFCLFVVAAFNPGPAAVVGGLVVLACLAVVAARAPDPDVFGLAVLLLVAWGSGRLSALQDRIARDLQDQARQAELARAEDAARAVELERSRISRELHDIVAHHISVIVVQARGGRRCLTSAPDDARGAFDAIEAMGGQALAEMRQLLGILGRHAQTPLEPAPSLRRMDPLLDQLRSSGQEVDLAIHGTPVALPPGLDLAAYRIVQEALTNVVKHTGHARARVNISYRLNDLQLKIDDDGPALNSPLVADGHTPLGLLGMRERVGLYGGTLSTGPTDGQGFAVSATLPLPQQVR